MSVRSTRNIYYVTYERDWNGSVLLKYVKQVVMPMSKSLESFSLWNDKAGLFEYSYYVMDTRFNYTGLKRFRRVVAQAAQDFVTKITEYAMRTSDTKFNVGELFNNAYSMASRVIVNGTTVRFNAAAVKPTELMYLINTIYVQVYADKYAMGISLQQQLTEERKKRGTVSWIEVFGQFIARKLSCDWADEMKAWAYSYLVTVKFRQLDKASGT